MSPDRFNMAGHGLHSYTFSLKNSLSHVDPIGCLYVLITDKPKIQKRSLPQTDLKSLPAPSFVDRLRAFW